MTRDEDLRHRAHAHRVGSETAEHAQLGRRLEVGAGDRDVDALAQTAVHVVRELA